MADKNEEGSETIVLRVFSDSEGGVYLMYEPSKEKVEVRRPVSGATLQKECHRNRGIPPTGVGGWFTDGS